MTTEQFCYWLQGLLECGNPKTLDAKQVQIVKDHLATVFHKVTPVRAPRPAVAEEPEIFPFKLPKKLPGSDTLYC